MRNLLVLCCFLMCIACAAPAPIRAQNSTLVALLTLDQRSLGKRSGTVLFSNADGTPVNDATVTVTAVMQQHGMILPPFALHKTPAGYQFDALQIDMAGEWQLQLRITRNGTETLLELPVVFQ